MATAKHQDNDNGDTAAKLPREEARQGQNIKGMMFVLGVGIALLVLAYAVMLALEATPVTPGGEEQNAAPASSAEETAQSPS